MYKVIIVVLSLKKITSKSIVCTEKKIKQRCVLRLSVVFCVVIFTFIDDVCIGDSGGVMRQKSTTKHRILVDDQ